jgi:L-ribulose-5-phosphate 4-epimerase
MDLQGLREHVCEANLELERRGLVTYTWGNVSGVDRQAGVMAIKPSGVPYAELTPDKIAIVTLADGCVRGTLRPSSDTPTHLALYRAFAQIGGIAHTHSPCATAFAQACRPIPCLGTTHADHFYGEVPVTEIMAEADVAASYEANTGRAIIAAFAQRDAARMPVVLVANHGPFTWGADCHAAARNSVVLETVARMAAATLQLNPGQPPIPPYLLDRHFLRKHGPEAYYGQGPAE